MPRAESDLDFAVLDRARSLGDLLKLLFALMEAFGPKDIAELLTEFDGWIVVDPETVGRWLRGDRRPSKQHLRLIVRLLQSRALMGAPQAKDRVFIRIAAFYAKLELSDINALRAPSSLAIQPAIQAPRPIGSRFRTLREDYELALALQSDLDTPGDDLPRFDAKTSWRRAPIRDTTTLINMNPSRLLAIPPPSAASPVTRWKRIALRLRAFITRDG